tara:strand:+ start:64 stop:486 length:423 start_codon:yes stop_codon:yes gene_type:complete
MTPEELILLQAIAEKNKGVPSDAAASTIGALPGGLLAASAIAPTIGAAINRGKDSLAASQGLTPVRPAPKGALPYKGRMAGGLVLGIAGGLLGPGLRDRMIGDSPEAALLARMQSGQTSETDDIALKLMLEEQYKKMGIA